MGHSGYFHKRTTRDVMRCVNIFTVEVEAPSSIGTSWLPARRHISSDVGQRLSRQGTREPLPVSGVSSPFYDKCLFVLLRCCRRDDRESKLEQGVAAHLTAAVTGYRLGLAIDPLVQVAGLPQQMTRVDVPTFPAVAASSKRAPLRLPDVYPR